MMLRYSPSAGSNNLGPNSGLEKATVNEQWIARVPYGILIEEQYRCKPEPEAAKLIEELGGTMGAICSGLWVEFWFPNYDTAFHFYMVYG